MSKDLFLLIDVDCTTAEVLVPWLQSVNAAYERQLRAIHAYPYRYADITTYDFGPKATSIGLSLRKATDILDGIWERAWETIPLIDSYIPALTKTLVDRYGAVDIVTSNPHFGEIGNWLDMHRIRYRDLRHAPPEEKLAYRILIEDNPWLVDHIGPHQTLLLRDMPYTFDIPEAPNIIRWTSPKQLPDLVAQAAARCPSGT